MRYCYHYPISKVQSWFSNNVIKISKQEQRRQNISYSKNWGAILILQHIFMQFGIEKEKNVFWTDIWCHADVTIFCCQIVITYSIKYRIRLLKVQVRETILNSIKLVIKQILYFFYNHFIRKRLIKYITKGQNVIIPIKNGLSKFLKNPVFILLVFMFL